MVSYSLLASLVIDGLTTGMILVILAAGLNLIFGLMRVVNFAHGVFYMIGAYVVAFLAEPVGYFPALVIGAILVGIVGLFVEYYLIRPLYDEDEILQLVVTFGVALVVTVFVKQSVNWYTGSSSLTVEAPVYLRGTMSFGFVNILTYHAFLILFGTALSIAIWLVLRRTNIGHIIRGGTRDPKILETFGINVKLYWTGVFIVGSALAGLAGGLAAGIRPVVPTMGEEILILVFVVVLVGGLGSYLGTVVAGLLIGQVMAFTSLFWTEGTGILVFSLLIVVLLLRPEGLMGEPEVFQ